MQKLTNVESQRLMAVMGDLLDRLNYLTYVPLEPQNELLVLLREHQCLNSAELLREHWRWEQLFLQSVDAMDSRHDEIAEQVRATTRSLCRDLRDNPVAVELLFHHGTVSHDRSEDLQTLVKVLSELADLTRHQLDKSVEDAQSKTELLHVAENRMKQAEDERVTIRDKLAELRKTKEEEVALLDASVQKLRHELQALTQSASQELHRIDSELKDAQGRAHEQHMEDMKARVDQATALQVRARAMAQEHQEEEDTLRKRKCKMAAELAALIAKYDAEMEAMDASVHELENVYEKEREQCQELQQHFEKIDEEQARIDAEERVFDEIRAREREKQMFIFNAATTIQKVYRGVRARREFAKMVAKTKKGGKKGGGAGKKGKKK